MVGTAVFAAALLLTACATHLSRPHLPGTSGASVEASTALRHEDAVWLQRVTFGLDSRTVANYRQLGRERYLDAQLHPRRNDSLPPAVASQVEVLESAQIDPARALEELQQRHRAIQAMGDDGQKEEARKALNEEGNARAYQAIRLQLLRAIYSPAQLREQMVWFWLNHFSVHEYKADLRWLVGDYEEKAVRPHALGHFRELVLATLEHPAMLEYLDNRQNAVGHLNENYARELMELHTLGVDGGYSQQDVQQLARVLTGVGINARAAPRLRRERQRLYVRRGAFEFNPARHDFGPKVLLGQRVGGEGFGEVEHAVTILVRSPACARFISRELATYFAGDSPPAELIDAMAATFHRTDGDIAATLRTLFMSPQLTTLPAPKFKDPTRYVLSAVRLAYDGRTISNTRPLLNWLTALGEPPYGRVTPDGYPLTGPSWESPGQMSRRFEIARAIGGGNVHLFDAEGDPTAPGRAPTTAAAPSSEFRFPQLSNPLYNEAIEPFLAAGTRAALEQAGSPQEWNAFLLSSPEMNYE